MRNKLDLLHWILAYKGLNASDADTVIQSVIEYLVLLLMVVIVGCAPSGTDSA